MLLNVYYDIPEFMEVMLFPFFFLLKCMFLPVAELNAVNNHFVIRYNYTCICVRIIFYVYLYSFYVAKQNKTSLFWLQMSPTINVCREQHLLSSILTYGEPGDPHISWHKNPNTAQSTSVGLSPIRKSFSPDKKKIMYGYRSI